MTMEHITSAQQIYLGLIEASGQWNSFDGGRIAIDLKANIQLWRSAVLTRLPSLLEGTPATELRHRVNLVVLRDLPGGHINLDTLFILPEPGQQDALEQLAQAWSPDELEWIDRRESSRAMGASRFQFPDYRADEDRFLLRVWWD
jgi:hypothetical protein